MKGIVIHGPADVDEETDNTIETFQCIVVQFDAALMRSDVGAAERVEKSVESFVEVLNDAVSEYRDWYLRGWSGWMRGLDKLLLHGRQLRWWELLLLLVVVRKRVHDEALTVS